jgi:hypothetical protein
MHFEILGEITEVETIATGAGIREVARLRKRYGRGRWRKRKGITEVRFASGEIVGAEVHWYEAKSAGGNLRSSASFEEIWHGSNSTTARHLPGQFRL